MAGTVVFIEASSNDGGNPGATATKVVDGSTVSGWVSSASVAVNTDIFLTGSSSISDKVSATAQYGYGLGAGLVGEPWNFSSGGGDEGNHIFAIINVGSAPDTLDNGGMGIVIADDLTTDSVGVWYTGPQAGSLGGWEYFVIDPSQNFDAVLVAGTGSWTTSGNPSQLSGVDGIGFYWDSTTSIMGASDNCYAQTISVGVGYRMTGTSAVFSEFSTYEETNRYGALTTKGGALFPLSKLRIGQPSGSAGNVTFTDSGFTVIWPAQLRSSGAGSGKATAVGFYGLYADQGTGTTDITLSNGLLAAVSPEEFDLELAGVNSVTITNLTADRARLVNLDSAVSWTGGVIKNSGQIDLGGAPTFTEVTIQDPTDADALKIDATTELANVSNISFDGAGVGGSGSSAILLTPNGGTYNFVGITFANRVAGSHDVRIPSSTTADTTINVSGGGGTPTVNNQGSGGVTINSNITINLTGLVAGSEVRVYLAGTGTVVDGVESSGTSFSFSVGSGVAVDIRIFNVSYLPADILNFSSTTDPTSIPIQQIFDRNYSNP